MVQKKADKTNKQTWNLILITSSGEVTVLDIPPETAPAEESIMARFSWLGSSIATNTFLFPFQTITCKMMHPIKHNLYSHIPHHSSIPM